MVIEENKENKNHLCCTYLCAFEKKTSSLLIFEWEIYFFLQEGAVSHKVLYYQQLPIASSQVSFYFG